MHRLVVLALLAICACGSHHSHRNHDGNDGYRRNNKQVSAGRDQRRYDQQRRVESNESWWDWMQGRRND